VLGPRAQRLNYAQVSIACACFWVLPSRANSLGTATHHWLNVVLHRAPMDDCSVNSTVFDQAWKSFISLMNSSVSHANT
jgi:hypothetical protein